MDISIYIPVGTSKIYIKHQVREDVRVPILSKLNRRTHNLQQPNSEQS